MIRKETYISFLLSILLFVSIDILFYNHIVLGKEINNDEDSNENEDNDNRDSRDDDIIEKDEVKIRMYRLYFLLMLYHFLNCFILNNFALIR